MINNYREFRINGDQRDSVLVGFKEKEGKIREKISCSTFLTLLYLRS